MELEPKESKATRKANSRTNCTSTNFLASRWSYDVALGWCGTIVALSFGYAPQFDHRG